MSFFQDDTDDALVKAAMADEALKIGWNDVPRPTPLSETTYRVIRRD